MAPLPMTFKVFAVLNLLNSHTSWNGAQTY